MNRHIVHADNPLYGTQVSPGLTLERRAEGEFGGVKYKIDILTEEESGSSKPYTLCMQIDETGYLVLERYASYGAALVAFNKVTDLTGFRDAWKDA